MFKPFFTSFVFIAGIVSQQSNSIFAQHNSPDKKLTSFVNPYIGTGGHGHTYPCAIMLFRMTQLSPIGRLDGCSGYHYSDEYVYGFSHTHRSGTSISLFLIHD